MAHGTHRVYGHGFTVEDVPKYLDEACKSAPHLVFKGKAAAVKRADAEAMSAWDVQQVEGIVAAQIEGFEGLWFVVWIYTDEQAAMTLATTIRYAEARAAAIMRKEA